MTGSPGRLIPLIPSAPDGTGKPTEGEAPMKTEDRTHNFHLDRLARGLADGAISRHRALKLIGAGAVAFVIGPVFPERAEALTKKQLRRCRRRKGLPVERGQCHCADTCASDDAQFTCGGDPTCTCLKTTENRGFCGRHGSCIPCMSSGDCGLGFRCAVATCCLEPTCIAECATAAGAASRETGPTSGRTSGTTSDGR